MTALKPKSDTFSQPTRAEDLESELRDRIQMLERSLHEELIKRGGLECELYQIKNSLAWKMLVKYRSWRDMFFADGTLRLICYELVRDFCKVLLLLKGQASDSSSRRLSRFTAKAFRILLTQGVRGLSGQLRSELEEKQRYSGSIERYEYSEWIKRYDSLTDKSRSVIRRHIEQLPCKPFISVVMPVYNISERYLRLAIESVRKQLYSNWELCIADDASLDPGVKRILSEYETKDPRIRVAFHSRNSHISAASNAAIAMAAGEFIAFLDHDDELAEHALYMIAVELNRNGDADLIYSDEDKIDEAGERYDPYFKPDWNPVLFLAQNFVCHLAVYRTCMIRELTGLRLGYEGAQDWDLAMRVSEKIPASHIRHIPQVLYHWRAIVGSTAVAEMEKDYVKQAQRRTLQSHFERIGKKAEVMPAGDQYWRIKYILQDPPPKVTIIIPTRNGFELLKRCLESIYKKTMYRNYELIIVDNQSDDPKLLNYLAELERERRVRTLRYDAPFNYAAINNLAVQNASGDIIGLLNNDLEVISPGWLEEMVSHAVQPEIGTVGALLYYPNQTIQHAGVLLGLGGVAGHAYVGQPRGHAGMASRASLCQELSAVTAACLVLRRDVFEKAGGLDETNLPIAFNDVDLCLRIKQMGYRNLWTPYAELYHWESATRGYEDTPEKQRRFKKEIAYMKRRWGELLQNDSAYNPNLTLDKAAFMLAFPTRVTKPWLRPFECDTDSPVGLCFERGRAL